MTTVHLRKIWTVIGAILSFYTLNAWLVSQGGNAIFDVKLLEGRPKLESLFAIPICSVLLITLSRVGILYSRQSGEATWHARLPIVWLIDIDTSTVEGRWYQGFFFLIYVVVPSFALIHFLRKVFDSTVLENDDRTNVLSPLEYMPLSDALSRTYWIGDDLHKNMQEISNAVTWFPVIEPIILICLCIAAWAQVAFLARALISR